MCFSQEISSDSLCIVRVCVPIQVDECQNFNPLTVPNLITLDQELEEYKKSHLENTRLADYKKTSLKPYIEHFENFVNGMILDVTRSKRGKPGAFAAFRTLTYT